MRIEGWESLLAEYIREAYHVPFQWGTRDCALWAAGWAGQATGNDYIGKWMGRYKTELGAARLMKKRGFSGPEAIADHHLESKPVSFAQRGDLLLHPAGGLGICYGRHGFFLTQDSVTMVPTAVCPKAWAV